MRDDQDATASLGIHVIRYRLTTMALSAAITAVAGGFFVQYYLFIDPDLAFGSAVSIQAILPAVIEVGTIWDRSSEPVILGPYPTSHRDPPPQPSGFLAFLAGRAGWTS